MPDDFEEALSLLEAGKCRSHEWALPDGNKADDDKADGDKADGDKADDRPAPMSTASSSNAVMAPDGP